MVNLCYKSYQQQGLYFDVIAIKCYWLTTINGSTINLARVSHELSEKEVLRTPCKLIRSRSATNTSRIKSSATTGPQECRAPLVSITWLRKAGDASCVSWDSGRSTRPGTGKSFRRSKPCACFKSHRERGFYLWWNVLTRSHVEQVHGLTSASVKALFSLLEQIYNRSKSPCLSISHHILFAHAVLWICVFHLAFTDIAIFTVTYKVTENVLLFMDHHNNVKFWISSIHPSIHF